MKIPLANPQSRLHGLSLIECLIYIAVLTVVTGIAFSVFFSVLSHHRSVVRCSDDIVGTVKAGERWRADIRAAIEVPRLEASATEQALHIRQAGGTITYLFLSGRIWRIIDGKTPELPLLEKVKSSVMLADTRATTHAWRWDLQIASARKKSKITPSFSFIAAEKAGLPPSAPEVKSEPVPEKAVESEAATPNP